MAISFTRSGPNAEKWRLRGPPANRAGYALENLDYSRDTELAEQRTAEEPIRHLRGLTENAQRKTVNVPSQLSPANRWLWGGFALLLLAVVAPLDYVTGRDFSFTLLYLAPIAIAIWLVGAIPALVLCFLAACCSMAGELIHDAPLSAALWNAGGRLGVYLSFYVILGYLREHKTSGVVTPLARKWIAIGAAVPCLAIVAAGIAYHSRPTNGPLLSTAAAASPERLADQNPLAELSSLVQRSLKLSRPLLLGSRDPNGPSCIEISRRATSKA